LKPIKITSRLGELSGFYNEEVAYFDMFDEKSNKEIRHYILLKEGIKLMYEPWGWKNRWYADLISIEVVSPEIIKLEDKYIDIIVEGDGPVFKIIDLEDYAVALEAGSVSVQETKGLFINLQLFLDNHFQRKFDFPPAVIKDLINH
jgi:hypothetical protein